MNVEKLSEILKSGRNLTPQDFGFLSINKYHYAKHPFELKERNRNWILIKWCNDDNSLIPKILLNNITLNTEGLLQLQKHLRNEKLEELLGIIS